MGWIKRHRGKLFFFSLILSIFYSLPLAMLIGLVIFLIVRAENKKALARGAKEGNIEGDWFERHKGLSASLILLFVITLPFTLFPILFLFALINSMLPELHDFTQTEANEIVLEILEKENIPIVKNIGIVRLPAMGFSAKNSTGKGRVPATINFNTVEECGKVCQKLIDNGYVDLFVESSNYLRKNKGFDTEAYNKYLGAKIDSYFSNSEEKIDGINNFDVTKYKQELAIKDNTSLDRIENSSTTFYRCKNLLLDETYSLNLCTAFGYFYHAAIFRTRTLTQPFDRQYGLMIGTPEITIEGRVTWYELYDYLEEQKND